MAALLLIAAFGLIAQLIDGGLGMGYGVITTSLLLTAGLAPAAASASVHLAEIGTSLASGIAHWKFGNIDWPTTARIAVPGAVGAFVGATLLVNLSTESASGWTASILIVLGVFLLFRFTRTRRATAPVARPGTRLLAPLGLVAGTVDATGGGGWGPIATTTLLASGKLDPRKTIGSVSAAEFAVAVAASVGFLIALADTAILWTTVAALLVGGVVAAPVAAWLVRKLPTHILGVAVGGIILVTNTRVILSTFEVDAVAQAGAYAAVGLAVVVAVFMLVRHRRAAGALAGGQPVDADHTVRSAVEERDIVDA